MSHETNQSSKASQNLVHPPRPPLVIRVGVTGHRLNKLPHDAETVERIHQHIRAALKLIRSIGLEVKENPDVGYAFDPPIFRVLSPVAEGADRMVTQEGFALGYELQCPLPFARDEYAKDFQSEESLREYEQWLDRATSVLELDGVRTAAPEAYQAVGRMVLNNCDVLLAIWDGGAADGVGGTAQIVREAIDLELPVIWVRSHSSEEPQLLIRDKERKPASLPVGQLTDHLKKQLEPPKHAGEDLREAYFTEPKPPQGWALCNWVYGILAPKPKVKTSEPVASQPPAKREDRPPYFGQYFQWADDLATCYANRYRSSFLFNYLVSGVAVSCAILGYLFLKEYHSHFWEVLFVGTELSLIVMILTNTAVCKRRRWHERWMDYRLLAEELRQMGFLAPLGRVIFFHVQPHQKSGETIDTWVDWYFRAVIRMKGLTNGRMDQAFLQEYHHTLLKDLLRDQESYHGRTATRWHTVHHNLHTIGTTFFYLTGVACLVHLALPMLWLPPLPHWVEGLLPWLTVCTAAFPAFGASMAGILSQGEFDRLSERSKAMSQWLKDMAETLEQPDYQLSSANLSRHAEAAGNIMIAEHLDWRLLIQTKPIVLPS